MLPISVLPNPFFITFKLILFAVPFFSFVRPDLYTAAQLFLPVVFPLIPILSPALPSFAPIKPSFTDSATMSPHVLLVSVFSKAPVVKVETNPDAAPAAVEFLVAA